MSIDGVTAGRVSGAALILWSLPAAWCLGADMTLGRLADFPPAFAPSSRASAPPIEQRLQQGYEPGLGMGIVSAGRFGYVKGDGLLACSCPVFGLIEKAYLTEHPLNRAKKAWALSFAPLGAGRAPDDKEDVSVNWVSSTWDSSRAGCRVTYNVATPGVLIETDGTGLRLGLASTPGYGKVVLPLRRGVTMRELSPGEPAYHRAADGPLADNWLMLWGSRAFPDVPLLLVLRGSPVEMVPSFSEGKLAALMLRHGAPVGYAIVATPFGMKALEPRETAEPETLKRAVRLSRFWSRALLAFVTGCKECYRIEWATSSVAICQEFQRRLLADSWDSRPVRIAPCPPVLALAAEHCAGISIPAGTTDLGFPTKYGPLFAVVGSNQSEYRLPIPPATARIPIPPVGDSPARRETGRRHRIQRHDGSKPVPPSLFPGFWSRRDRSSVDAASMTGDWLYISAYLDSASRRALKANARDFLIDCLDDQELFSHTALYQSIERTPADAGKLTRPTWFRRAEPYTGKEYLVSYTVPNVRRKGQSITDYRGTFTDLEWGNGLGLFGVYHMARLSGAWDVVRKNWSTVRDIYALFEMLQDWACMSVSGTETGRRWTDTASYGGYIAFREMARHIDDVAAWHEGVYLHAKHAAMRMAMFNSGTYVHQFYGAKPWRVHHSLVEMPRGFRVLYEPHRCGGLRYLPDELRGRELVIQKHSFYSLVAEGPGYECPDLLYTLMPDGTAEFLRLYLKLYPEWKTESFCKALNGRHRPSGGISLYQILLFLLRDPGIDTEALRRHFGAIASADLIHRYLPPMYRRHSACHEYAHALLETRDDPAWLEDWHGGTVAHASYDRASRRVTLGLEATGRCEVRLGGAEPASVKLDGQAVRWSHTAGQLRVSLPRAGVLTIGY